VTDKRKKFEPTNIRYLHGRGAPGNGWRQLVEIVDNLMRCVVDQTKPNDDDENDTGRLQ
jgi:hypothetical protein